MFISKLNESLPANDLDRVQLMESIIQKDELLQILEDYDYMDDNHMLVESIYDHDSGDVDEYGYQQSVKINPILKKAEDIFKDLIREINEADKRNQDLVEYFEQASTQRFARAGVSLLLTALSLIVAAAVPAISGLMGIVFLIGLSVSFFNAIYGVSYADMSIMKPSVQSVYIKTMHKYENTLKRLVRETKDNIIRIEMEQALSAVEEYKEQIRLNNTKEMMQDTLNNRNESVDFLGTWEDF